MDDRSPTTPDVQSQGIPEESANPLGAGRSGVAVQFRSPDGSKHVTICGVQDHRELFREFADFQHSTKGRTLIINRQVITPSMPLTLT